MSAQDLTKLLNSPTPEEIALVEKAYAFAEQAHKDHKRLSGEPYFIHLFETAKTLAEMGMSGTTVSAGLLHDCIEDVGVTPETVEKEFGKEILFLVQGVTKLGTVKYHDSTIHRESMRRLFVAMSQDIRVLIIKLADRLHNMKTLSFVPAHKQKRIAEETLEIYTPLAYRLGMRKLSREFEDLAFVYTMPEEYKKIKEILGKKGKENIERLQKFYKSVKKAVATEGIVCRTDYRVKSLYSLYKKIQRRKGDIASIYDIIAMRIIVKDNADCYRVLGIIHGIWRPLPGRIKDYIAFPKPNGYSSLHTTVFTGDGSIVEIQIKTEDMYADSEFGITSHIAYKGGLSKKSLNTNFAWVKKLLPQKTHNDATSKDVPDWVKQFINYKSNNDDLIDDLKSDFLRERIFVFTPKGDVIDLPVDSSTIDFAFSVHSDIGFSMSGAKVNGKISALDTKLKNGDIVEIITKPKGKPTAKWIDLCKTTIAQRHIRAFLNIRKK